MPPPTDTMQVGGLKAASYIDSVVWKFDHDVNVPSAAESLTSDANYSFNHTILADDSP